MIPEETLGGLLALGRACVVHTSPKHLRGRAISPKAPRPQTWTVTETDRSEIGPYLGAWSAHADRSEIGPYLGAWWAHMDCSEIGPYQGGPRAASGGQKNCQ